MNHLNTNGIAASAGAAAQDAILKQVSADFPKDREGNPCTGTVGMMKAIMYGIAIVGIFCSATVLIMDFLKDSENFWVGEENGGLHLMLIGILLFLIFFFFIMKIWLGSVYTLKKDSLYIKRFVLSDLEISYQELARYARQWQPCFMPGSFILVSESGLLKIPFGSLKGGCKFCELLCLYMGVEGYPEKKFIMNAETANFKRKDIRERKAFCKSIRKK